MSNMSLEEEKNLAQAEKNSAVRRRALKLAEAVYRTTELMFDGEPLKWSLRQSALEVIHLVSALSHGLAGNRVRELRDLHDRIDNLFMDMELASAGAFVSRSNFEVLHREYTRLKELASDCCGKTIDLSLSDNILLDKVRYNTMSDKNNFRSFSDLLVKKEAYGESASVRQEDGLSVDTSENRTETSKNGAPSNGLPAGQAGNRKGVLLSALQKNGPSSVGELVRIFDGEISEKTVQRELNSMVETGMAKMAGDKRWRRYFAD